MVTTNREAAWQIRQYRDRIKALSGCWKPHAGQKKILRAIFNDGCKRIFVQAGRKFGKTELCMYAAWRIALLKPRSQAYIIGPTRKQEGEILWATRRVQDFGPKLGQQEFESEFRIEFPWHSFIKIDGSEKYESYRGTEYDIMILDEYKDADPRFYKAAYPNLLAKDGVLIVIGTPPDTENHFMQLRHEIRGDPAWRFFYATSYENDTLPGGEEWLNRERDNYYKWGRGAEFEREYMARFIPGGANAVFPMFQSLYHVRDKEVLDGMLARDRHKCQWYTISDPATSSIFCTLFICYNPYTSQVFVMDEIYEGDRTKTTALQIWERIAEKCKALFPRPHAWQHVYDEAASWFSNEVRNYYNVGLTPTAKAAADPEMQISLIKHAMMAERRFWVASHCKSTIHEITNYATDEHGKYPRKDDHAIDCLRYFFDASGYTFDVEAEIRSKNTDDAPRFFTPESDFRGADAEKDPLAGLFDIEEIDSPWMQ